SELVHVKLDENQVNPEDIRSGHTSHVALTVQCDNVYKKEARLLISQNAGYLFLQSDKPIYNPGHTVLLRMMAVGEDFLPSVGNIELQIKNPQDILTYNTTVHLGGSSGMHSLPYRFPDFPMFGVWKAIATYGKHRTRKSEIKFQLAEYVVPTFSVELHVPSVILPNQDTVKGKVVARYVYGKDVNGSASLKFKIRNEGGADKEFGAIDYKEVRCETSPTNWQPARIPSLARAGPHYLGNVIYSTPRPCYLGGGDRTQGSRVRSPPLSVSINQDEYRAGTHSRMQSLLADKTSGIFRGLTPGGKIRGTLRLRLEGLPKPSGSDLQHEEAEWQKDSETLLKILATMVKGNTLENSEDVKATSQSRGLCCSAREPAATRTLENRVVETFKMHVVRTPAHMSLVKRVLGVLPELPRGRLGKIYSFFLWVTCSTRHKKPARLKPTFISKRTSSLLTMDHRKAYRRECLKSRYTIVHAPEARSKAGSSRLSFAVVHVEVRRYTSFPLVYLAMRRLSQARSQGVGETRLMASSSCLSSTVGAHEENTSSLKQNGASIAHLCFNACLAITDGSCEAKKWRRRSVVRQSIESYKDPLLKECCWLGIQRDRMARHCSTRSEIVEKYMPGPDGARCAEVFAKCCMDADNFDRGRIDALHGPTSIKEVIDAHYDEDLSSWTSLIRKDFRETWLFFEQTIGENGVAEFQGSLPHSITKWFVQAMSVSPMGGVCVAEPAELTVFQKVFLKVDLPYKVVRNEQLEVVVTVYNYGDSSTFGVVFLHGVPGVCTGARHQLRPDRKPVEVMARSAASVTFPVIPTREGEHTIRVLVNTSSGTDGVEKLLRVVPEGITVEKNISIVLDPTNLQRRRARRVKGDFFLDVLDPESKRQSIKIDTQLPMDAVPNTGVCSLAVIGERHMEPAAESAIDNVESLISLPRGCGEQNMMLMAPTLYALEYLKLKNSMNTAVMEKAYRYIQRGYEQELTFRNKDGSFSSFKQKPGSLWLTAFVLRVFCKATTVINIDHQVLHSGVSWLANQQKPDGDFHDDAPLMHGQMLGGVNGRVPMTAFVLLTLCECGSRIMVDHQTMVRVTAKAERFLNEHVDAIKNPYIAALVAYTLVLCDGERKQEAFQVLKDHMLYDEEMNELSTGHDATALEVEGTSYALLAYLRNGDKEGSASLVNWLNRHRSASGSFTSTQDTVVALQALTESGLKLRDSSPDLVCNITASRPKDMFKSFQVRGENAAILQELHIKEVGGKLLITVNGEGTGILTVRLRYNVLIPPEKVCKFSLSVRVSPHRPNQSPGRSRLVPLDVWNELLGDTGLTHVLESSHPRGSSEWPTFCGNVVEGRGEGAYAVLRAVSSSLLIATENIKKLKAQKSYDIEVCVRYLGEDVSNMAILEVGMFTGFQPIKTDLENLVATNDLLGKFEITSKAVVFYFDKVPSERPTCIMFGAEREYVVQNIQTATVKVYDYYRPEHSCSQFYGLDDSSPLLGLFCDGPQCKCALAECPLNETFEHLAKSKPDRKEFRNALTRIACNDHHFLWEVNVSDIQPSNGYKNILFNVTKVVKEGEESKDAVAGKIRSFLMRQFCNTVNFAIGRFYYIFGHDGEFLEEKGSLM
ncbi:unnamed protein product, partial [Ixodes hexagonus]